MLTLSFTKKSLSPRSTVLVKTLLVAIGLSVFSSFCCADSSVGMGIRLTIVPATTQPSPAETPLAIVENLLASNELYGLELDTDLSGRMTDESATDLLRRLEQNQESDLPTSSAPVVFTLTAG